MTKEDFFEYFQEVQIVRLTPESLNDGTFKKSKLVKKEFFGSWQIGSTAGGCGDYNDCKYASTFATNPQFLIKFDGKKNQNCSCTVALMQKGHNGLTSSNIGDFLIGKHYFTSINLLLTVEILLYIRSSGGCLIGNIQAVILCRVHSYF